MTTFCDSQVDNDHQSEKNWTEHRITVLWQDTNRRFGISVNFQTVKDSNFDQEFSVRLISEEVPQFLYKCIVNLDFYSKHVQSKTCTVLFDDFPIHFRRYLIFVKESDSCCVAKNLLGSGAGRLEFSIPRLSNVPLNFEFEPASLGELSSHLINCHKKLQDSYIELERQLIATKFKNQELEDRVSYLQKSFDLSQRVIESSKNIQQTNVIDKEEMVENQHHGFCHQSALQFTDRFQTESNNLESSSIFAPADVSNPVSVQDLVKNFQSESQPPLPVFTPAIHVASDFVDEFAQSLTDSAAAAVNSINDQQILRSDSSEVDTSTLNDSSTFEDMIKLLEVEHPSLQRQRQDQKESLLDSRTPSTLVDSTPKLNLVIQISPQSSRDGSSIDGKKLKGAAKRKASFHNLNSSSSGASSHYSAGIVTPQISVDDAVLMTSSSMSAVGDAVTRHLCSTSSKLDDVARQSRVLSNSTTSTPTSERDDRISIDLIGNPYPNASSCINDDHSRLSIIDQLSIDHDNDDHSDDDAIAKDFFTLNRSKRMRKRKSVFVTPPTAEMLAKLMAERQKSTDSAIENNGGQKLSVDEEEAAICQPVQHVNQQLFHNQKIDRSRFRSTNPLIDELSSAKIPALNAVNQAENDSFPQRQSTPTFSETLGSIPHLASTSSLLPHQPSPGNIVGSTNTSLTTHQQSPSTSDNGHNLHQHVVDGHVIHHHHHHVSFIDVDPFREYFADGMIKVMQKNVIDVPLLTPTYGPPVTIEPTSDETTVSHAFWPQNFNNSKPQQKQRKPSFKMQQLVAAATFADIKPRITGLSQLADNSDIDGFISGNDIEGLQHRNLLTSNPPTGLPIAHLPQVDLGHQLPSVSQPFLTGSLPQITAPSGNIGSDSAFRPAIHQSPLNYDNLTNQLIRPLIKIDSCSNFNQQQQRHQAPPVEFHPHHQSIIDQYSLSLNATDFVRKSVGTFDDYDNTRTPQHQLMNIFGDGRTADGRSSSMLVIPPRKYQSSPGPSSNAYVSSCSSTPLSTSCPSSQSPYLMDDVGRTPLTSVIGKLTSVADNSAPPSVMSTGCGDVDNLKTDTSPAPTTTGLDAGILSFLRCTAPGCRQVFDVNSQHMIQHTTEKGTCGLCAEPMTFESADEMSKHMLTHSSRVYACQFCGKENPRIHYLKIHVRSHTGEKPYTCLQCGRGFADASTWRRHERVHTGEKPYQCTICGRKIARRDNVKIHMRSHKRSNKHISNVL